MRAVRHVRAIVPILAALSFACGGGLGSNSASVVAAGSGGDGSNRAELTISSTDWNTLLAHPAQCSGGPGQPGGMQPGGAPPPAAVQACASKAADDACSMTTPDGNTLQGKCLTPPGSSQLACVPPLPPPPAGIGDGPAGGGVSVNGSLVMPGQSAIAVSVRMLPAPPGATQRLAIAAHQDGSAANAPPTFVLVPQPPQGQGTASPAPATQGEAVELFVDSGNGLTDFGAYVQLAPRQ